MLSHYLMFNRNCAEALEVYSRAFDAKITALQHYGDMPSDPNSPVPENDKKLVLHSRLQWEDSVLMCSDTTGQHTSGNNMYVSIGTQNVEFVRKAWDILKENGDVYMDLSPTFFAAVHGSLQDKFGINWMFTAGITT